MSSIVPAVAFSLKAWVESESLNPLLIDSSLRPAGTMRAFFHHQRINGMGIYLRPGRQDLTADVNFSDLELWGEKIGLATIELITQAKFIHRWSNPKSRTEKLGDQFVADQSGMGAAFKVLHQHRG